MNRRTQVAADGDGAADAVGGARADRRAEPAAASAPDTPEERSTGLPPQIDWTFNFDAGWGTFGFANSLYNNPKDTEPGEPQRPVVRGLRQAVALRRRYTLASSSEIYGKVSVVGERTYGSAPELYGPDVSSFGPEDASIGWRSGKSIGSSENLLDVTVGRAPYRLGHGFLLLDGAAEGGSRGGYWTNARKAFEFAAIGRVKPGPHTVEVFYLDKDELAENDTGTRLWGANYEITSARHTTIGATYMKFFAHPDVKPERDGLNVFNLRAYSAPIPQAPDLSRSSSSTPRSATATLLESNAWTLLGAYQFSTVAWKPKLSYRYAFFQGDDPDTTANESVRSAAARILRLGLLVAGRDRRRVLPVELQPDLASGSRARRAERQGRRRADLLRVPDRSAERVRPDRHGQPRRVRRRCVRRLEGEQEPHWSAS